MHLFPCKLDDYVYNVLRLDLICWALFGFACLNLKDTYYQSILENIFAFNLLQKIRHDKYSANLNRVISFLKNLSCSYTRKI